MTTFRIVQSSVLALAVAVTCNPTESRAADWPQFGRDGTRNAVSPERRPPTSWDIGKLTDTKLVARQELFTIAAGDAKPVLKVDTGHWPQWRGPNRDNASTEKGLLREWPEGGPPLLWTATGIGTGVASVSVAEGKIITFGYQADSEYVVALEEQTGELSWATRIGPAVAENPLMRWLSQRAATIDGERLYVVTAGGELVCLATAGGKELWRKSYPAEFGAQQPLSGFCDSPLVDGDRLICTPGGPEAMIVALDKLTGNVIWKTQNVGESEESAGYGALVAGEARGLRYYATFLETGLVAVAADDGRLLWRYDGLDKGYARTHAPLVRDDQIFCSSGFSGQVALLNVIRAGMIVTVNEVYKQRLNLDPYENCTALVGDQIYAGSHQNAVVRLNWKTGEIARSPARTISQGRLAMVAADGCLYYRSGDGRMRLVQATPEKYIERGTFVLPDQNFTGGVTSPVIAGRRLYLRDENRLLCYDIRAENQEVQAAPPRTITLDVPAAAGRIGAAAKPNAPRNASPPRGVFVPTPHDVVKQMLEIVRIKKTDVVYDLGSGDGRIVIAAAKDFGCKAVGYEIDAELVGLSQENAKAAAVDALATFVKADVFDVDAAPADVVTLYLLPEQIEHLIPQLKKMKRGSRVVTHQFAIAETKPTKTVKVESTETGETHTLYLYTLPFASE